jgi:AcrR family transcriptional regulator
MSQMSASSLSKAKILAPRGRGRPKAENVLALTNHIVLVARDVFFEVGLGNATMDVVAQRARISKETLYTRFRDKSALFEAVIQATLDAWAEGAAVNPVVVTHTLEDAIRHDVEVQVKAMLSPEFQGINRLILSEINTFPNLGRLMLEKVNPDRITSVANKIRKYAEIDGIPCRDAETAVEVLRGMIGGWFEAIRASGEPFGPKQQKVFVDRIVEIFMASRAVW